MNRHQYPPRSSSQPDVLRRLATWFLYGFAGPAAALEAISLNSVFVRHPAIGALQAFAISAVVVVGLAYLLAPRLKRHELWSRLLVAFAVFAMLSMFVMRGKFGQIQATGAAVPKIAFAPVLGILGIQLGLAVAYLMRTRQRPALSRRAGSAPPWWWWGMAAGFAPVVLIGGLVGTTIFGSVPAKTAATAAVAPDQEIFNRFPKPEDFVFAPETPRAGKDAGGSFVHYQSGRQPLLGFAFSNRKWMGDMRISSDLRGVFDRDTAPEGDVLMLAKPGFAVAGLEAQVNEHVHAIRVQFARLHDWGLDVTDSYWSDWTVGFDPGGGRVELGGTGDRVLGLTGTSGLVVNSLGLMIEESTLTADAGNRSQAQD
jgi:hypothetical protein